MLKELIKKIVPKYFIHKIIIFIGYVKFEKKRAKLEDEWVLYRINNNEYTLIDFNSDYEKLLSVQELIAEEACNLSPGLYRLINPSRNINKQFLIKSDDILRDMKNMMFMFVRGNKDSRKSFDALCKKAMRSNLVITCGNQANFVIELIDRYYKNIKTRKVYFLTCEEFNYYNDGHVAIEVFQNISKQWVLVDLMRDVLYKHTVENRYMSACEMVTSKELCKLEEFSKSVHFDIDFKRIGFEYTFFEQLSYSEIGHKIFIDRIMQSLIIPRESSHYCFSPDDTCKSKIEQLYKNAVFLNMNDFTKKFYEDAR